LDQRVHKVKGQVALEFIMMVSFMLVAFIVIMTLIFWQQEQTHRKEEQLILEDTASMIQVEILTAEKVSEGYARTFIIPASLQGAPYTVGQDNHTVIVSTQQYSVSKRIPEVHGELRFGLNSIRTGNGTIYVN